MERNMRRVHHERRQVSVIPTVATGSSLGVAAPTTLGSENTNTLSLITNPTASTGGAAFTSALGTITVASTVSASDATATASTASDASTSSATSKSIPIGTVIGICIGVFGALSAFLLLIFYFGSHRRLSKQQRANGMGGGAGRDAERRRSGRELWVKMEDKDSEGGYEKYAITKRTTMLSTSQVSTGGATTVERSITVKSAKSAKTFKSLGYGTGLGLSDTFRTPELPPHIEFSDGDIGSGRGFALRTSPSPTHGAMVHPGGNPVSWDGASTTVAGSVSYLDLKHDSVAKFSHASGPVSPSMVGCYQTPPAVETSLHQWEEAEVVSPEGAEDAYGGFDAGANTTTRSSQETVRKQPASRNPFTDPSSPPSRNPFTDAASIAPAPPSSGSSASFFSSQTEMPTPRSGAFSSAQTAIVHHERADSERAMASLIAALGVSDVEARERLSAAIMPTPRASGASELSFGLQSTETDETDETLGERGFNRFPLPPTDIEHHVAP